MEYSFDTTGVEYKSDICTTAISKIVAVVYFFGTL